MKKFLLYVVGGISLLPILAFAGVDLSGWKYEKQIKTPNIGFAQYVRLPLDSDVSASGGFGDIRIVNGLGVEVPYQLIKEEYVSKTTQSSLMNNSSDAQGRTYFTLDLGVSGQIHNQVSVETSTGNYRRQVSVYASDVSISDSSSAWKLLTDVGYIYKFTDQVAGINVDGNQIFYPKSTARYLKIIIGSGPEGAIKIVGARVAQQEVRVNTQRKLDVSGSIGSDETNKATLLTYNLGSTGVFTNEVTVSASDKNFSRRVIIESSQDGENWNFLSQGSVSHLETPLFSGGSMTLLYPEIKARYIRLRVFNQDDQALSFESKASFRGPVYAVVFESTPASSYSLFYGNSGVSTPIYDLSQRFQYLEVGAMPEASLGLQSENSKYVPPVPPKVPFTESNKYLLNIFLVILVLGIGVLIFFYLKKTFKTQPVIPTDKDTNGFVR